MEKNPHYAKSCIIFLLAKAYQKAHGTFKPLLAPFGLTNMQHLVLEALWIEEGVTAAELGKALVLDKATISGVLDRMVESGWIEKRRGDKDKRVMRLFPTSKANNIKDDLIKARVKANDEILSSFSLEERLLFKRLLIDLL